MARELPVHISFVVGSRAFRHLVDHVAALTPSGASALEEARQRGCIAGVYYFVETADAVARDVRDCLRGAAVRGAPGDRACTVAAEAIENRRRIAWYAAPCPRCGGRFRPRSGLMPRTIPLACEACHGPIPE